VFLTIKEFSFICRLQDIARTPSLIYSVKYEAVFTLHLDSAVGIRLVATPSIQMSLTSLGCLCAATKIETIPYDVIAKDTKQVHILLLTFLTM